MAKNRIAELKEKKFNQDMEDLQFMHEQQRQECEDAHITQFQEFNEHWDNEMRQAYADDEKEILALQEHHEQSLETQRQHMEATLPGKYKASMELLNMRAIEQSMAKQKKYKEAHEQQ